MSFRFVRNAPSGTSCKQTKWCSHMTDRSYIFVAMAFLVMCSAVVFSYQYPPLVDYPNHLARMHIIANQNDPAFAPYYRIELGVPTNLIMDIWIPFFDRFLPLAIAGKSLIFAILAATIFAPLFLSKILRNEISAISLVGAAFVFNAAFMMGFLNFVFSVALAMYAFGIYIWLDRNRPRYRTLVGSILAVLIFLSHVYGFVAYALCIAMYYVSQFGLSRPWQLTVRALQFVPAAVLLAIFVSASISSGSEAPEPIEAMPSDLSQTVAPGPVEEMTTQFAEGVEAVEIDQSKSVIPYPVWSAGVNVSRLWKQYAGFSWLPIIFLGAIAGLYVRNRTAPAEIKFVMPVLALVAFAVLLPGNLWGAWNVNWRFVVPAAILGAGVFVDPAKDRFTQVFIVAGAALLMIVQTVLVNQQFQRANAHQSLTIEMMRDLPPGSRIISMFPSGLPADAEHPVAMTHLVTLGVVENKHFVPSLFAFSAQQPLQYRAPYDELPPNPYFRNFDGADWREIDAYFDYVLIIDHDGKTGGNAVDWFKRVPFSMEIDPKSSDHVALAKIER